MSAWWLATLVVLGAGGVAPDPDLLVAGGTTAASRQWQVALTVSAPMTTTDPHHIAYGLGIGRHGRVRVAGRYHPSETDPEGFLHATLGLRLRQSDRTTLAVDAEHSQVWSSRRLYRNDAFQFEGHDRRLLSLGVLSLMRRDGGRWWGLFDGFEIGGGRMAVRDLVATRFGNARLNDSPVSVLKSAAPVGVIGLSLSRPLVLGAVGSARVRVVGAGHSRGGVVPFAHVTTEWEVTRSMFTSAGGRQGRIGFTGVHASHSRAAVYFQNGIGLTLKFIY